MLLKTTPFHSRVEKLCESHDWRRWAGYLVASKYELTHEREYHAIRSGAGLIDVSPLYKYLVSGRDAARLLNRVMTRDIGKCAVGQVLYTTWCDEKGKTLEDGTVTRLAENRFRVTAAEPNLRWFQDNAIGLNEVHIEDISETVAALALQGPTSRQILQRLTGRDLTKLRYFRQLSATIADRPVDISRTGYTGDLGYELWLHPQDAEVVWDALIQVGEDYGLVPAGMLALDIARIEAGLILIEVDYTPANKAIIEEQKSSPFELGLGWTVDLKKEGYFVGRRYLEAEQKQGSRWQTVGLEIDWDSLEAAYAKVNMPPQVPYVAWRSSTPLFVGNREVGYATSGCFSPLLKRYIALATIETAYVPAGTQLEMEITVEHFRRRAKATVAPPPFFNPERKRK